MTEDFERQSELEILRQQLAEAHATLDAIRSGQVDAVMVELGNSHEVFTLQPADLPYREFVEQMAEGALSLDRNYTISYANRFFSELVRRRREDLLAAPLTMWLSDESRETFVDKVQQGEVTSMLATVCCKDGSKVAVRLGIVPPRGTGTSIGVVVSDQRVVEQLAHEREARTAAVAESHAKDRFLAVLGHELRNPLAALTTSVELLVQGGKCSDSHVARSMERQVRQLRTLIDELLDLSRVVHGKVQLRKEPTALAPIVRDAVAAVHADFVARNHRLEVAPIEPELILDADAGRLEQVLTNLLANAAKYTPPSGAISLVATEQDDRVLIQISDNGMGIHPDQIESIFEPFVQVGVEGSGGLGIGLTLVRQLVDLHGGSIVVRSEGPGRGTTVDLDFPRGDVTGSKRPSVAPSLPQGSLRGVRVLVVDDNEDAADLLVMLLGSMGAQAERAYTGQEGLSFARAHPPDVVLLDLGLPDISGYDVARRLRDEWGRQMKIVALTGFSHADAKSRVQEAGFDAHLIKPVGREELHQLFARYFSGGAP